MKVSCQLPGEGRTLRSAKKAFTHEELAERFGARSNKVKRELVLAWPCTKDFKKEICRKLTPRCKYVRETYRFGGEIVVKFHDTTSKPMIELEKTVLYELRRIVDGKPSATMAPRRPKSRRGNQHTNKGRMKGRQKGRAIAKQRKLATA